VVNNGSLETQHSEFTCHFIGNAGAVAQQIGYQAANFLWAYLSCAVWFTNSYLSNTVACRCVAKQ
jgi:hypothetical protein